MALLPETLNLWFRTLTGRDHYKQVSLGTDSRIRHTFDRSPVADPIHFELDTFPHLPVITTIVATSDKFFLVGGTNAVSADVTQDSEGGINVATHGASADQTYLAAQANNRFNPVINASSRIVFEARVQINQLTACFGSIGLNENVTDPDPTGTAGEGAMFLFDPTDVGLTVDTGLTAAQHLNWVLCHKVNGADTFDETDVPLIVGKDYNLRIEIDKDLKANYYIDGVSVGQGPALTSGDSVKAFAGIEATGAAVKSMDLRYIGTGRSIG